MPRSIGEVKGTPRAFATLDLGAATTATALIGRVAGRWRLLGALAAPASAPVDVLLELLAERIRSADPDLAATVGLARGSTQDMPHLVARSLVPGTVAVFAASARALEPLTVAVARSGWRWRGASGDRLHAGAMTALLLDPAVSVAVVGAGDPPGGDERAGLPELVALAAAAAQRRPDLTVVLAGSAGNLRTRFGLPGRDGRLRGLRRGDQESAAGVARPASNDVSAHPRVLLVPRDVEDGVEWAALTAALAGLRRDPAESRQAMTAALGGLAGALDRRVELLEIGLDGGLRASATPGPTAGSSHVRAVQGAGAALVPYELSEARLEAVQAWSTQPFDRHRLRDRLLELRAAPWTGVAGDGARLRLAAARAALSRLAALTPEIGDGPAPDLVVMAGGAFAPAPAAAILLALADAVRRPAAIQVVFDHARLLGPLGTVSDPVERDILVADLAGDLLLPLGSIVMPGAIRPGRRAGRVIVDSPGGTMTMGLDHGALEFTPVPPGEQATVLLESAEPVLLGSYGRRLSVDVAGGVGGLLIDLRDVPLRLPDRREARRELLARWEDSAWPGGTA